MKYWVLGFLTIFLSCGTNTNTGVISSLKAENRNQDDVRELITQPSNPQKVELKKHTKSKSNTSYFRSIGSIAIKNEFDENGNAREGYIDANIPNVLKKAGIRYFQGDGLMGMAELLVESKKADEALKLLRPFEKRGVLTLFNKPSKIVIEVDMNKYPKVYIDHDD